MRPGQIEGRRVIASWRSRLRKEDGVALVLALISMMVLTIALTTVMFLTAAGARDAQRTNAGQRAYSLAESGLNNALAVLEANYPGTAGYPGDSTLLTSCPASLPTVCPFTSTYASGSVQWSGTLSNAPAGAGWADQWNVTSTATVNNPTGPTASPIKRTVTAVVPVIKPPTNPIKRNNPLNFIYGNVVTFLQSGTVASPVYTTTDLVMQNTAVISEWIGNAAGNPNKVAVGGNFYEQQNANKAGHVNGTVDPTNDVGEMYIQGQCSTKANSVTLHACAWGSTDQIWATTHGSVIPPDFLDYIPKFTCCSPYPYHASLAPFDAARSSMGEAYRTADLGPLNPCTTGSLPTSVFPNGLDTASGADNDINNSATPAGSAAINLTPSGVSYSCKTRAGQLSWNGSNKLTVNGTVFLDGSATVTSPPASQALVTGQGTLVLTGTFMMKNALLCAKTTGSGNSTHCDMSSGAWDPNVSAFIVMADGDGGYDATQSQSNNVIAGQGINVKSSDFQGGLIANKDISIDTTSRVQGPMISVYHTISAGQSNTVTFPPILFAPSGESILGPPPVPRLLPPQQFGGG